MSRESLIRAMVRLGWTEYDSLRPYMELANALLSFRPERVEAVCQKHGIDIHPVVIVRLTNAFEVQYALDCLPWHKRLWRRFFK